MDFQRVQLILPWGTVRSVSIPDRDFSGFPVMGWEPNSTAVGLFQSLIGILVDFQVSKSRHYMNEAAFVSIPNRDFSGFPDANASVIFQAASMLFQSLIGILVDFQKMLR